VFALARTPGEASSVQAQYPDRAVLRTEDRAGLIVLTPADAWECCRVS